MKANKKRPGVEPVVIPFPISPLRPETGRVPVQYRKPFTACLELGFLLVLASATLASMLFAIGAAVNISSGD
jgi:hypothetical protein